MSKRLTHMIRGSRWWLESDDCLPSGQFGECVWGLPGISRPTIRAPFDGDEEHELNTILHEIGHAALGQDISEEAVCGLADAQSEILWQHGWRKDLDA